MTHDARNMFYLSGRGIAALLTNIAGDVTQHPLKFQGATPTVEETTS